MSRTALAIVLAALGGCVTPTRFLGSAQVPDGPIGCKAVCDSWDMELAGMVQMGEYSNGCICQVRGRPASSASAANPAAAGVYLQMMAAAAQQQQEQQQQQDQQHPYVPGSPVGSPGWRPGLP